MKISYQVCGIFQTDRYPDQAIGDALLFTNRFGMP